MRDIIAQLQRIQNEYEKEIQKLQAKLKNESFNTIKAEFRIKELENEAQRLFKKCIDSNTKILKLKAEILVLENENQKLLKEKYNLEEVVDTLQYELGKYSKFNEYYE